MGENSWASLIVTVGGFITLIYTNWWNARQTKKAAVEATVAQTRLLVQGQLDIKDGVNVVHALANDRLTKALSQGEESLRKIIALEAEIARLQAIKNEL